MIRIVVVTAVAGSLLTQGALAADLSIKTPTIAPVAYNWTGLYIGGNVGYGWGHERDDGTLSGLSLFEVFFPGGVPVEPPSVRGIAPQPIVGSSNPSGMIGGGQVGYNWQWQNWLLGLEADIQGSDQRADGALCSATGCATGPLLINANYRLDWFGTFRGRAGILAAPQLLLYATGGLAYGHFDANAPSLPSSWGATHTGWTVGAGGEVALDSHWSIKAEYLYMDLGRFAGAPVSATTTVTNSLPPPNSGFTTVTTNFVNASFGTRFTDNIVRVGVNYRFSGPPLAKY
ncbi:outer membrane protein [Bradyrhizobium viridifuturi]|uniref:outer membrane protein n=1 Tax=Bradyrhizobium viridifuturi TaxID=1654716 RepID=UPI000B90DEB6|nr:outer membrane beta-barrel protein [Bradyrhizobium viridifuturi]